MATRTCSFRWPTSRLSNGYCRNTHGPGIRDTLIAAGRDTWEIASLCGNGARWGMSLAYGNARDVRDAQDARDAREARETREARDARDAQDVPAGQGLHERVREVAAFTKGAPFMVTLGPLLLESDVYMQLVQLYRARRPCGIRAGPNAKYTSGTPHDAAEHASIYLMAPRTCEVLVNADTRDHTLNSLFDAALDDLAGRGETVLNLDAGHPPYDVRSPEAYLASNERLLASDPEYMGTALPEIMDDNFSSPNLVLRPPVIVDKHGRTRTLPHRPRRQYRPRRSNRTRRGHRTTA